MLRTQVRCVAPVIYCSGVSRQVRWMSGLVHVLDFRPLRTVRLWDVPSPPYPEANNRGVTFQKGGSPMPGRTYVTRREYNAWISECYALAVACGYPVQPDMANDNTGLVFGEDQYEAFVHGMWSREPYEVFAIFQALNEPAIEGLPQTPATMELAQYGGLCDKLMIVHPGKFCSPHLHWRKTEFYEVVLGEMDLFYAHEIIEDERLGVSKQGRIGTGEMKWGDVMPKGLPFPRGREHTYEKLRHYERLKPGDPKFVMHRLHLHAFGCPRHAKTPVVIREGSAYSHEPTASGKSTLLSEWQHIHDNGFLLEGLSEARLKNNIREE